MHNREDSKKIKQIANLLRKHEVPFDEDLNDFIGLRLVFPWANGADVVCHEGTFHVPESIGFPWDQGDVSRDYPEQMAEKIIGYYHDLQQPAKVYNVHIEYDVSIEAHSEHEAITFALANISDADVEVCVEADPRQEWIDEMCNKAIECANGRDIWDNTAIADIKFCKDVTIFIRHWIDDDDAIGMAAPRHGDKYDRNTGIAVAFAKAMGIEVPSFI